MEKFIFLFRGGMDQNLSNEAMQASMQKWNTWMGELGKKGLLLAGEPLEAPGKVLSGTKKTLTDGPFAEAKEVVGGYLVVNAATLDQATEIAKGCPIFEAGGSVEIRQVRKMEMPR
jgi:hypothetical protein